ncbi:MAG: hypothetical protein WKG07_40885 [Hymenobacter sp.]
MDGTRDLGLASCSPEREQPHPVGPGSGRPRGRQSGGEHGVGVSRRPYRLAKHQAGGTVAVAVEDAVLRDHPHAVLVGVQPSGGGAEHVRCRPPVDVDELAVVQLHQAGP